MWLSYIVWSQSDEEWDLNSCNVCNLIVVGRWREKNPGGGSYKMGYGGR